MSGAPKPPAYWEVVGLLLGASYRRAVGRRRRQRALFFQRAPKSTNFAQAGFILIAVVMALLHVMIALSVVGAVEAGLQVTAGSGRMVVDQWFINDVLYWERLHGHNDAILDPELMPDRVYRAEAEQLVQRDGGDRQTVESRLRQTVFDHGTAGLMSQSGLDPGLRLLPHAGPLAPLLGSLLVLIWFVMMAFQGEGLELDIQRRRHPMWEWLFSHPVPQGAVFLADMVSPMAANPIYFSAPLFPGVLFGLVYGPPAGFLAAVAVGIPVTLAASCFGKALEVAVTLRFAPRSRGAMIGLMGWLGYATMLGLFMVGINAGKVFVVLGGLLAPLAILPWPYLGWFVGLLPNGTFSLAFGIVADFLAAVLIIAVSVRFSVWGAARGLTADQDGANTGPRATRRSAQFGKDALYRKELLWFARDRSALVQALLIPLSLAGFQLLNLRRLVGQAGHQWNTLCGAAVIFGTYFLLILGPKSLASEGGALWLSLTWPHGLEKLLQAKARLWALLATGLVALVLIYAAVRFPADAWRIALLGIAWYFFARSMAAKTVTLATITSESGELQKVPWGRKWAAQLGLLTFSIGVVSQQWNLVVMGVVYSVMTATAMWQNFRARLPYLYDPWSEVLPPAPTLMHAMIGISVLVEVGATITGVLLLFFSREQVAVAHAVIYGLCAAAVSAGMAKFLSNRDVAQRDVWNWFEPAANQRARPAWWNIEQPGRARLATALMLGLAIGGGLGTLALGYVALLKHLPTVANQLQQSSALMRSIPNFPESFFVMAVLIAPFAEEFLFRGLLYRALDKEAGGWRALLGSAAFFAVYHPMLSWPPVFLVGIANAMLFKKTGRLAPAVMLHMTYNAIVFAGQFR